MGACPWVAHDDVTHPRKGFVIQSWRCFRGATVECARKNRMHILPNLGVVPFSRYKQQSRYVTIEFVEADEQPHFRPLPKIQNSQRGGEQFVFRNLEQLVARQS